MLKFFRRKKNKAVVEKVEPSSTSPSSSLWIKDFFSSYSDRRYENNQGIMYEITHGTQAEFINYLRNYLFPLSNAGIEQARSAEIQVKYDEYMKPFRELTNAHCVLSFTKTSTCDYDRFFYVEDTRYHFENIPMPEFVAYLNLIKGGLESIEITFLSDREYPLKSHLSAKLLFDHIMTTYGGQQTDLDRQDDKLMRPC